VHHHKNITFTFADGQTILINEFVAFKVISAIEKNVEDQPNE